LQETGHGKLTGHISCNTISKLCNWKLIILQVKISGGAIEADRIGHQTHGGFLRIYYTRRKDAGRQEKIKQKKNFEVIKIQVERMRQTRKAERIHRPMM